MGLTMVGLQNKYKGVDDILYIKDLEEVEEEGKVLDSEIIKYIISKRFRGHLSLNHS